MKRKKLKNAPLKEAIFELYWKLPLDEQGFPLDPEFDLAQGRFASLITTDFPVHKRTMPAGINLKVYPKPLHQFWKGELTLPVVQYGPGILTVNDNDRNYIWENGYRHDIQKSVETLISSYKEPLQFNRATLKYIDSVDIPEDETDISKYISKNFQTDLINRYEQPGKLKGININQVFELTDGSLMNINIQTAINNTNGKPAIVWVTAVDRTSGFQENDIYEWVDHVHIITSDVFIKMLNPEFYASFDD